MIVEQDVQANNDNQLSLRTKVLGNSKSSVTKIHRSVKIKHRNLKQILVLSLELTISMVLVGGALMVALNGMNQGISMP
jgi:nucleoside recognition membrane protein YjiH